MKYQIVQPKVINQSDYDRILVVGDIHGCNVELRTMIEYFTESSFNLTEKDLVVFLGDYIDRGPDSPDVIKQLLEFQKQFPATIFLRGNHEDMFLDYLGFDGSEGDWFLHNGGTKTIEQYIESEEFLLPPPSEVLDRLPKEHIDFFRNLKWFVETEDYYFVHAGFNSCSPMDKQVGHDLVWTRDPFTYAEHDFGKIVVHGHTPVCEVKFKGKDRGTQLNIDTGCVFDGIMEIGGLNSGHKAKGYLTCFNVTEWELYQVPRYENKVYIITSEQIIHDNGKKEKESEKI